MNASLQSQSQSSSTSTITPSPAQGDGTSATTTTSPTPTIPRPLATAAGGASREYLYKILVVGDLGTGKTSIIKRYVHGIFSMHYKSTIGVDFALKVLQWTPEVLVRLQLWDIAGQERFGNMTRVYYKEAVGALVVFDVTRISTFDGVQKWKTDIDEKVRLPDGSKIPVVLLANKVDLGKDAMVKNTQGQMEKFCQEKEFCAWYETSAKDNLNIEEACKFLIGKILENDQRLQANKKNQSAAGSSRQGIVRPGREDASQQASGGSCCA